MRPIEARARALDVAPATLMHLKMVPGQVAKGKGRRLEGRAV